MGERGRGQEGARQEWRGARGHALAESQQFAPRSCSEGSMEGKRELGKSGGERAGGRAGRKEGGGKGKRREHRS